MESLLGEVRQVHSVLALDKMQHIQILQFEAIHIRHLTVRIDGVAEIGGVYILVAQFDSYRCRAEP